MDNPVGNPVAVTPVTFPAACMVILLIGLLMQTDWLIVAAAEVNVNVLLGATMIEPVVVMVPQPPVKVIV